MTSVETNLIADIEDLIEKTAKSPLNVADDAAEDGGGGVQLRNRARKLPKYKNNNLESENGDDIGEIEVQSFVPGTHKIYIKTWGCAHNSSDSEYMAGLLAQKGYPLTESKKEADLWLLNSCTVKNPAEDHFRNEVNAALDQGKKVVTSGCVGQGKPNSDYLKGVSILGVQQIDRVVEVVEETLKGNSVRLLGQKKVNGKKVGGAKLNLPKVRKNPLVEIIAINTGCLNQCTYCKTKHARGNLASYPIAEIVERAKQSFLEGVVEIWLTSEDTGAYGRDIGVTLPELLWELVKVIPENCRLRLGMTNPPYIMDHLDEMAKILNHPQVYAFLHVPVQSGSDAVLRDMKREYNVDEFSRVVNILRQKVPNINIITDIICGFPTETEDDFEETLVLCRKYKFRSLFINQFFPRPGTPAARLKRIPTKEVKRRTKALAEFFASYSPFQDRVGTVYEVLVTETSHDGKFLVGHNRFYEQVLVPKNPELLGKMVKVKIVKTCKFSMTGELLNEKSPIPANGNSNNKESENKLESSFSAWVYQGSVVILFLAILIRLVQLLFLAQNNNKNLNKSSISK